jgi:hypothetical protein
MRGLFTLYAMANCNGSRAFVDLTGTAMRWELPVIRHLSSIFNRYPVVDLYDQDAMAQSLSFSLRFSTNLRADVSLSHHLFECPYC